MALTADRNTKERDGELFNFPLSAGAHVYAGGMAALDADGYCVPASALNTLNVVGRCEEEKDNSAGADGDLTVEIKRGVFLLANSADADEITRADVGNPAYVVDDETVAKTSSSGARPAAGIILDVDSAGVWVAVGYDLTGNPADLRSLLGVNKLYLPIHVANLAGATGAVYRFTSPVAGTITALRSILEGALTVGDAAITGSIGGTNITDGALALTQADSAAGDVDSATPSALNTVTAGQACALTVSGTNTATVSAMVMVEITF